MKILTTLLLLLSGSLLFSQSDAKAVKLLAEAEQAVGGWDQLYRLNDVRFDYDYAYPGQDKKDVSTERYIFEGEQSFAEYSRHDVNVAPGTEGTVTQSYVGGKPYIMMNGKMSDDPKAIGGTEFLRRANYFWFTMFYKLNNPGVIAKYKGTEKVNGTTYEVVNVSYDPAVTGKAQNDEFVYYLNPKTNLVDRFFFSLPAMGVNAPVILMELDYKEIDGLKIATTRRVFQPGPDGKLGTEPNLVQTLTNVKFDNGFRKQDFMLK